MQLFPTTIVTGFFLIVLSMQSSFAKTPKLEEVLNIGEVIWGLDFRGTDEVVFTTREGKLWVYNVQTKKRTRITGVPKVAVTGQGGLLDVRVDPENSERVFLTYAFETEKNLYSTHLASAVLKGEALTELRTLLKTESLGAGGIHFGSRIEFDGSGKFLFVTVGDRNQREQAQAMNSHMGKVLRLDKNGEPHPENQQAKGKGPERFVFSWGHRNPQGLFWDVKRAELWSTEFGPRGGDELNLVELGKNYGWPLVTKGREYWGPKIGVPEKSGFVAPVRNWTPSISPSALVRLRHQGENSQWQDQFLIACLSSEQIVAVQLGEKREFKKETSLFQDQGHRFRALREHPTGEIWAGTDEGRLLRFSLR